MKKQLFWVALFLLATTVTEAQNGVKATIYEYRIVTSIESVVPMGLGRSRIIENDQEHDYAAFTTTRSTEGKAKTSKKRKDAKIDDFRETTLLNFYSAVGINFQNVASNDSMLSSMISAYAEDGWELAFVTSGVESDAGSNDGKGIFITRFIFKRPMQQSNE
ncbi:MAG: hypothetical protein ACK4FS_01440 [Flavobacterium sp.]